MESIEKMEAGLAEIGMELELIKGFTKELKNQEDLLASWEAQADLIRERLALVEADLGEMARVLLEAGG